MRRNPESSALGVAPVGAILALGLVLLIRSSHPAAADPPDVACSSEKPIAATEETITLRAWTDAARDPRTRYLWWATAGHISGQGRTARWDLSELGSGGYAASVRVDVEGVVSNECLIRVIVYLRTRGRGSEGGWALLIGGHQEATGYGLYSYLLLGSPPSKAAHERYLNTLEAYWRLMPEVGALERYVQRAELNIAYLPVTSKPASSISPDWLLANYDYARARSLLRHLPGETRDGPYIVSTLTPLGGWSGVTVAGQPYLFQDLSRVPPHLAATWVKEFLNQAASERVWDDRTGAWLAKRLRLTVANLAEGLPDVTKALNNWISWVR
jgi:hypothetical protein